MSPADSWQRPASARRDVEMASLALGAGGDARMCGAHARVGEGAGVQRQGVYSRCIAGDALFGREPERYPEVSVTREYRVLGRAGAYRKPLRLEALSRHGPVP